MSRTVLAVALGAVLALSSAAAGPMAPQDRGGAQEDRVRDPVCNLMVRKDPELSVRHSGQVYYFCMKADMEAFRRNPDRYLGGGEHDHPETNR